LNQDEYRKIVSGQRSDAAAAVCRIFLKAGTLGYGAAIHLRNLAYDKGAFKSHEVDAAVISVGNITAGGTGKTPLVIRLANYLQQRDVATSILTRGYKSGTRTDEPHVLAQSCPGVEVIVNPDRVAGAAEAIGKYGAQVLIMDDGFQHRRLHRDLDILTVDATCPFGYGRLLPAGLLREPIEAIGRADAVVITRCDQVEPAQLQLVEAKLRQLKADMVITRSIHAAVCAKTEDGTAISIDDLKGKKIYAFCAIGNPQAFFDTISRLGGNIVGTARFNDHHHFDNDELAGIRQKAAASGADIILTTQKDWSRLAGVEMPAHKPTAAYLEIELKITAGEDRLKELIERVLTGKIRGD